MTAAGGIFITGSSSGIGQACTVGLDKLGYQVFAGVRKDTDGEALRQLHGVSGRLTPIIIDILNKDQVTEAAETITRMLGDRPLLGLINNAGISSNGPLEFIERKRLLHQMEVNVIAQVSVTQSIIPLLRKNKGRIINIGSISGLFAVPMMGPYCASKFAMEAISDVMRRELKRWDIKVILLEPGAISTKIWGKAQSQADQLIKEASEEMLKLYKPMIDRAIDMARDSEKHAQSPDVVVKAVVHALTSPRPKTRYIMGSQAWPQKIITMLPDRIQDLIVSALFRKK